MVQRAIIAVAVIAAVALVFVLPRTFDEADGDAGVPPVQLRPPAPGAQPAQQERADRLRKAHQRALARARAQARTALRKARERARRRDATPPARPAPPPPAPAPPAPPTASPPPAPPAPPSDDDDDDDDDGDD